MLTSELAVNRRRGDKVFPLAIKTDDAVYLRDARILVRIFEDYAEKTRGELERELEDYVGAGTDYKILRGFIKLLFDRCEFETSSVAAPEDIRRRVFLEASKFHPVLPDSPNRLTVLEAAAGEFQTDTDAIESQLYADLSAQQKLIFFETIEARELLDRYNLAQAQALLYKCVEMEIFVEPSAGAANYRAIFSWTKRFGMIHSVAGNSGDGYKITLTGAASLFHRSQKYGIQMAVFLPALLLCGDWRFSAEIASKEGGSVFYELASDQTGLVSHYLDDPGYENSDIEKLKKNWAKLPGSWQLIENNEIVDLGKTAFIPDFVLISPAEEKVYLDVLGFWTPKSLQKRLAEFGAANFSQFVFAASHELRGSREEPLWTHANVVFYKTKIEPSVIVEAAENVIKSSK